MSAKRPSIAWDHFKKLGEECTCIHCGKVLKYNRSRTTNLLKHLRIHGIPGTSRHERSGNQQDTGQPSPEELGSEVARDEFLNSSTSTESHVSFQYTPTAERGAKRPNPFSLNGSSILNHPAPPVSMDDAMSHMDRAGRFRPMLTNPSDISPEAHHPFNPLAPPISKLRISEVSYTEGYAPRGYSRSYNAVAETADPEVKRLEDDLVDLFYHWNLPYQMIESAEFLKLLKNLTNLPILNSNRLKIKILDKIRLRDAHQQ
jgi:hypothetical protein